MKAFQDMNKKWGLTVGLILALASSLSVSKHNDGSSSVELASTSLVTTSKIKDSDGEVLAEVTYVKYKDKTLATVTEGTICASCGTQFLLDKDFKTTKVSELNAALRDFSEKAKDDSPDDDDDIAAPKKRHKIARTSDDDDEDIDYVAVTKEVLARIDKACGRTGDNQDKLECYGDKFTLVLKSEKQDKLDADALLSFYKNKIENRIDKQMAASRLILDENTDNAVNGVVSNPFSNGTDFKSASEIRLGTQRVIEGLLSGVPERFDSIRHRLTIQETNMIRQEALDVRDTYNKAKDPANALHAVQLYRQGNLRASDLHDLVVNIKSSNDTAYAQAVEDGYVDPDKASAYQKYFNTYAKKVLVGMASDPQNFQIPGTSQIEGGVVVSNSSVTHVGGTLRGNSSDLSISARTSSRGGSINRLVLPGQNSGSAVLKLDTIDTSDAGSMTFSDQIAATPEMLAQARARSAARPIITSLPK